MDSDSGVSEPSHPELEFTDYELVEDLYLYLRSTDLGVVMYLRNNVATGVPGL